MEARDKGACSLADTSIEFPHLNQIYKSSNPQYPTILFPYSLLKGGTSVVKFYRRRFNHGDFYVKKQVIFLLDRNNFFDHIEFT